MSYYRRTSHSVYDCTYHIVWTTKYRRPVLVGDIGYRIRDLIRQGCDELNVEIIRGNIVRDHVHLYATIPPYLTVSKVVQRLKGRSSRKIQQEYTELRKQYWGRHFWAIGYFVRTSGNVTDKMIKKYIEAQKKESIKHGDFQVQ